MHNAKMKPIVSKRLAIFASLFLFVLASIPRLIGITHQDVQGDELFWNQRSSILLQAIQDGHWDEATSHLGHPAIPAASAMALAKFINQKLPVDWQTDALGAARIGNAVFSSLAAPLIFIGMFLAFPGVAWAALAGFLAALFISFDPQHLAISRIAHVDSSFSLFVTITVLLYLSAVLRSSTKLKILAGIGWGFCLACKPTAFALLPAFLLFKIVRLRISLQDADRSERQVLCWSDVWAVLTGFATLALIFTRFWHHEGQFVSKLGVKSQLADSLYTLASWPNQHLLVFILFLILLNSAVYKLLKTQSKFAKQLGLCFGTIIPMLFVFALFPAVLENFARYFIRLPSLAEFVHFDSGYRWATVPFGYVGLFCSQIPTFSLICFLSGLVWILIDWKTLQKKHNDQCSLFVICSSTIVSWILVLSIASKELVRYIVPILPLFYLLAAYGLSRSIQLIGLLSVKRPLLQTSLALTSATVILLNLATLSFRLHPFYLNFYNDLSGGLSSAVERGYAMFYQGHTQALAFLDDRQKESSNPLQVAVVGDIDTIKVTYQRASTHSVNSLLLSRMPLLQSADYVLIDLPMIPVFKQLFGATFEGLKPLFTYNVQSVPIVTVYEVLPFGFKQPISVPLFGMSREIGGTTIEDLALGYGSTSLLYALPGRHQPGTLFFGSSLPINAGKYHLSVSAALPHGYTAQKRELPYEVLRVELGEECELTITTDDLTNDQLQPFSTECTFDRNAKIPLTGYWSGNAAIVVDRLTLTSF